MKNCWAEKIQEFATNTPDKVAIIDEETKLTYKKLWEYSCGFAKYLKQQGHQKGQVVVCKAFGKVEYVVVYLATLIAKGVFAPFDKEFTLTKFCNQVDDLPNVFCVVHDFEHTFGNDVNFDDVLTIAEHHKSFDQVQFDVNDDAQILFTSGSTAKPKAVLTTNAQPLQSKDMANVLGHQSDTIGLIMSPVHHYAFWGVGITYLYAGGTFVMFNEFNLKNVIKILTEYKVNSMQATPSMLKMSGAICKEKFGQIFGNIRSFAIGGEFVPQPVKDWLKKELPNSRFCAIYGSTETAFVSCHRFDSDKKPFGCAGQLLPKVEIEICNVEGSDVVAVKSPYLLKKYLGSEPTKDWFVTKDLAYFKDDCLYVLGRADDVIISGGTKINPLEIEAVAKDFDGISQTICVGVKDEFLGQVAKLYYLSTRPFDLKELKCFLAQRIEKACLPKVYEQIDQIRTTPTGKLDRKWYKNYER
ncbi:MAG: acyl--CoA ligase [Clostridia bacterium]|nr:acyl--CoA ligase [Clostridia bacterium]